MHLINAGKHDIEALQHIVAGTWPATYGTILTAAQIEYMIGLFYSPEALAKQMDYGHHFLLATEYNVPVGFAGYEVNYEPSIAKLHKLYVLPQMQGKNVGQMLLQAVKEAAHAAHQQQLILNVNRYNKAIQFYEKSGFSILREEDIDIGQGYFMNDYVMGIAIDHS